MTSGPHPQRSPASQLGGAPRSPASQLGAAPRSRREQLGGASLALLGLTLVLALVALAAWLALAPSEGPTADTVAPSQTDTAGMDLPDATVSDAEQLNAELPWFPGAAPPGETPDERIARLLTEADYPRGELHGRVVMDDGGPLPEDLVLYAKQDRPDPEVVRVSMQTLSEVMSERPRRWSVGGADRVVPQVTRTLAQDDGTFVMPNFPLEGAYIQAETELAYQADAQRYTSDEVEPLLLLTRAAVIEGQVLGPDGRPATGARVKGMNAMDPYAFMDTGMLVVELDGVATDDEGRFRMAPVPVGTSFKLHADDGDGPLQSSLAEVPELVPAQRWEVAITLAAGCTVAGQVLDAMDQPVPGLVVHLQPAAIDISRIDELGRIKNDESESDDGGRFGFSGLPDGAYLIMLGSADYLLARSEPIQVKAGQTRDDLILRAVRGALVRGRVVDADGEPVPSAHVKVAPPPSFMSMRANAERGLRPRVKVDQDGRFALSGYEEGSVRVWADADGFVDTHVDAVAGGAEVEVPMERHTSISGIAMSLVDGEPLSAYTVRASPAGGLLSMGALLEMEERLGNRVAPLRVRDEEGRFSLSGVAPGSYDLFVTAEGFATASLLEVEVLPGEGARGLIFMVPEEATVSGQVVSGRSGLPLEGAEVTTGRTDMMGMWTSALEGGVVSTRTDEEGRFELTGLGDEPLSLALSHATHQPLNLERMALRPGEQRDVGQVSLSPGSAIWGLVSDDRGLPEPGVTVMAAEATGKSMRRARTDEQGMYRVEGLSPGTYNVMRMDFSMSLDNDNAASFMQDMVFEAVSLAADSEQRCDLTKTREGGTRLEGVVSSDAGPEADAMLWIVRETGGAATRFGSTDARGDYHFDGLQPGRWLLQVLPSGEAIGGGSQPSSPVSVPVVVGSAALQRLDVDVPGGLLRGEVVSAEGDHPLEGVRVILERTDEGRPSSRFVEAMGGRVGESWTNARGEFTFEHLPSGTYSVVAGGQNIIGLGEAGWAAKRVEDIHVVDGSPGLTLEVELDPGGSISGTVTDSFGKPLGGVPVWGRNDTTGKWLANLAEVSTDGSGRFTINSLDPGAWTLALGGDSHALTLVHSIIVNREKDVSREVSLELGVEVFVDCGPYDPYELLPLVTGPDGRLPTHLVSMDRLLSSGAAEGRVRVGRVLPGSYELSVLRGSEVVHSADLDVSGRESSLTIVLGEGD